MYDTGEKTPNKNSLKDTNEVYKIRLGGMIEYSRLVKDNDPRSNTDYDVVYDDTAFEMMVTE